MSVKSDRLTGFKPAIRIDVWLQDGRWWWREHFANHSCSQRQPLLGRVEGERRELTGDDDDTAVLKSITHYRDSGPDGYEFQNLSGCTIEIWKE